MSKRHYIAITLVVGLGLIVALLAGLPARPAVYNGKTLSQWCLQLSTAPGKSDRDAAEANLKRLGTNVVPALILMLERKDSIPRTQIWKRAAILPIRLRRLILKGIKIPDGTMVRAGAARGLGVIGPEACEAVIPLIKALHDPDRVVCWEASSALGSIGGSATEQLKPELRDSDPVIRQAAASALSKIGSAASNAAPDLILLLIDKNEAVRTVAGQALSSMGPAAGPALLEVIEHHEGALRLAAVETAVRGFPSRRMLETPLIKMAGARDPASREQAIRSLGDLHASDEKAVAAMTNAFADEDPEVRSTAAEAVGRIGFGALAAKPGLERLLEDSEGSVKAAAAAALTNLSNAGK